ncbi:MAG: sulfatase [Chloroflexi bacterium]|nr:sulfatase [Chloroflexota bacterium]
MPTRPNLLVILLDTMRRDRLSLYGHSVSTSPALDSFAESAVVYDRAISPAQWTIPAHASMFTGVYPTTHDLTEADRVLPAELPTAAELLRDSDYHTVGFCNNPLVGVLDHGLIRGFDAFYNYAGAAVNRPFERQRGAPVDHAVRRWRTFARAAGNQFAQREWLFRVSLHPLFTPVWTRLVNYKGSSQNSVDDLIGYMQKHRAGRSARPPLFAFLNLMGTHLPYRPPQDVLDSIAPRLSAAEYRFVASFNADAARWASPVEAPLEDWQTAALETFYDAEIRAQDRALHRLFDYLRASRALSDTVVIVTADHGEGHGDHGYFGHSFVVNHELTHVPLVIRHPDDTRNGTRSDEVVSTRRVFHTLLDGAGIDMPGNRATIRPADLSLLNDEAVDGPVFTEAFPPQAFLSVLRHRAPKLIHALSLTQVRRGIINGDLKLTTLADTPEALYDVHADPAETRDLLAERPDAVAELLSQLNSSVWNARRARCDLHALAEQAALTPAMMDSLRALGYIE